MLAKMIENRKIFGSKGGVFASAPFREFSISGKLLAFWAKKSLLGVEFLDQPNTETGVVDNTGNLILVATNRFQGIGYKLLISIPRDQSLSPINITFAFDNSANGIVGYPTTFKPNDHDQIEIIYIKARQQGTYIWPVRYSINSGSKIIEINNAPQGTSVLLYDLDLNEEETRNFILSLE